MALAQLREGISHDVLSSTQASCLQNLVLAWHRLAPVEKPYRSWNAMLSLVNIVRKDSLLEQTTMDASAKSPSRPHTHQGRSMREN
jgi:hypothetical protein